MKFTSNLVWAGKWRWQKHLNLRNLQRAYLTFLLVFLVWKYRKTSGMFWRYYLFFKHSFGAFPWHKRWMNDPSTLSRSHLHFELTAICIFPFVCKICIFNPHQTFILRVWQPQLNLLVLSLQLWMLSLFAWTTSQLRLLRPQSCQKQWIMDMAMVQTANAQYVSPKFKFFFFKLELVT